jgi:hypothetical protein
VLSFHTDLPTRSCPLGVARIEVSTVAVAAGAGRIQRQRVVVIDPADVAEGSPLSASSPSGPGAVIVRAQHPQGAVVDYLVRLPDGATDGFVTVTDPTGRTASVAFGPDRAHDVAHGGVR